MKRQQKQHLPPPVGTPWSEREIERSLAYRTQSDGTITGIEICHSCKQGFPPGLGKLGYGSGHGLCRSCTQIGKVEEKNQLSDRIMSMLKSGPLSTSSLMQMLGEPFGVIEAQLRQALANDQIVREGQRWAVKS